MFRGRGNSGPQGESEAPRDEARQGGDVSRTNLRGEFDATSEAMQMVTDRASGVELAHWLNSLQTSLTAIERAITKYKNFLEDCRMQEEEAHQEEVISQEREEEEGDADAEMMEEGERDDGEPSGPQGVAETEEVPPLVSAGDAVSPEEDTFLMQPASCNRHPNL